MKYLLLLLVVGIALYLVLRRSRARPESQAADEPIPSNKPDAAPAPMLACAHCGVHLPHDDAVTDGAGRAYCGEAHRVAGPR